MGLTKILSCDFWFDDLVAALPKYVSPEGKLPAGGLRSQPITVIRLAYVFVWAKENVRANRRAVNSVFLVQLRKIVWGGPADAIGVKRNSWLR
jgi:hypothetical protein